MATTFNKIGIQSVTAEFIESVEVTKSVDTKLIKSTDGGFGAGKGFDPKFEFSLKGRGSTTITPGDSSATLGSSGFLPDSINGGITIVTSVKVSQKNDDYDEFEISGVNYPEAALSVLSN